MKLMEWADINALYKRSRKQPNKLIFKRENAYKLWPWWMAVALTVPLGVFASLGIKNQTLIPYAYMALAPWGLALYFTRLHALRVVYPQQFAEHAIDRQPLLGRENILCYAFFLKAMRDEGYTAKKIRELSAYAELTGKPVRPALSQNLGFASLIALMVAISTEVIKTTALFSFAKGSVILLLGVAVLFIYWLVLDGIHSSAYERVLVKRYLDMAAYDMEDLLKDKLPNCFGAPANLSSSVVSLSPSHGIEAPTERTS